MKTKKPTFRLGRAGAIRAGFVPQDPSQHRSAARWQR
jgi:hypothetical protein